MKKYSFWVFSIFLCVGFRFKPQSIDHLVKDKMVRINAGYFCDKHEVSNKDWQEYRKDIGTKHGLFSEEYLQTMLDTTVWRSNEIKFTDPMADAYHYHPAFGNYPVVGVSYKQVQGYIAWQTAKTNEALTQAGINELVGFRLPTKQEWEDLAAKEVHAHYAHKFEKQKAKNVEVENFWSVINEGSDFYMVTAPVDAFFPNTFGLYNMQGNVAEMVQDKGIVKGGSWRDRKIESPVNKDFSYENPTCYIGFRLVMIVQNKMCGVK